MPTTRKKVSHRFSIQVLQLNQIPKRLILQILSMSATVHDKPLNPLAEKRVVAEGYWPTDTAQGFYLHQNIAQRDVLFIISIRRTPAENQTPCTSSSEAHHCLQWVITARAEKM